MWKSLYGLGGEREVVGCGVPGGSGRLASTFPLISNIIP